jgi:hypothetical protein
VFISRKLLWSRRVAFVLLGYIRNALKNWWEITKCLRHNYFCGYSIRSISFQFNSSLFHCWIKSQAVQNRNSTAYSEK